MKTATSIPATNALVLPIEKGFSQEMLGSTESGPAVPEATLTSATTANSASVMISAPRRPTCVRADSSIPMTQIEVMIAIHDDADERDRQRCCRRPTATRRAGSVYRPAICARLAMTMMSATTIAQPPIQPAHGPSPA